MKNTRRNRKQEYLNGLEHDLNWYTMDLADRTKFIFWVHGERMTRKELRERIAEIVKEQKDIAENKGYKPWKMIAD